jgi:type IV pilus assembly protein PilP
MILLLAAALLMSGGCKGKEGVQKPAVNKPKTVAAQPQAVQKPEEKVEKEVYDYEATGRRDPFMSLIVVAKEKPHRRKGATPIENFDVDEIKLTAIIWDNHQYYALIALPDGKSYTIRKGMALGLYGGKVADITKDSVLIREQVRDYKGQLHTKETRLKLRKEGEE